MQVNQSLLPPSEFLSFAIMNRGPLTIFIHPLGKISLVDHTTNAQFLGQTFPVDTTILSDTEGDPPQYPELGLGYAAPN
jgi:aromatic ring-cleaving dioxygenase